MRRYNTLNIVYLKSTIYAYNVAVATLILLLLVVASLEASTNIVLLVWTQLVFVAKYRILGLYLFLYYEFEQIVGLTT